MGFLKAANLFPSVVVPVYNKGENIFAFLDYLVKTLENSVSDYEIIIVDDGSKDNTRKEAFRYKGINGNKKVRVFSYPLNVGKGFALSFGFSKSNGDPVIFLDAGLDLHPRQVKILLDAYLEEKPDIVVGSKRHPLSKVGYPLKRKFYSFGYQVLIKFLFGLGVRDTQVGLKLFRREVLEKTFPRIVVKKWAYDVEILVVAKKLGFNKIREVPVEIDFNFPSAISWDSVRNMLVDSAAIFYRKNVLRYYDREIEEE